jgi:hypothetical protein
MADEQLSYPSEQVVGIVADRDTLGAVDEQLRDASVGQDQIDVLCGEDAQQDQGPEADADSSAGSLIRSVRTAMGDEAGRLEHLNDAIKAGSYVVQVDLPAGDDDEQEAAKQRIGKALVAGGATSVAFYGRWQIEELQPGA